MHGGLKIGELARRAGVTAKAIRFYERRRVLPPARRAPNGYRLYGPESVELLTFVRQAGRLGLTLAEIKDIVAIGPGGPPRCTHVRRLLLDKAAELDQRLEDLLDVRRRIRRSLAVWKTGPAPDGSVCPCITAGASTPRRSDGRASPPKSGLDLARRRRR
jgi:DNA-binding transcriptional MerR regulator